MSQEASYEQEQQQLQAQSEGEAGEIRIAAPKEPEVDIKVYRDVEPILFRGFLTISAEVGDRIWVFKSLNHHEMELLRFSCGDTDKALTGRFWSLFLAYGVFMIDGQNVLADRNQWLPEITQTFESFPLQTRSHVIRVLSEVNRRATDAVLLTEAYATEAYSRYYWAQYKGLELSSPAVTGIEGTSFLGLNWAQLAWRALNHFEDLSEQVERDWDNAKFVGACMAGKGISKVYQQDADRRQKEKEAKLARKDRILRHIVLGESLERPSESLHGAMYVAPKTVEDLAEQLEKDLRGEKDWHDRVIEEKERKAREAIQQRRQHVEQIARDYESQFGSLNVVGGSEEKTLSPQEVAFRVERQRQVSAQARARQMAYPELLDPKAERFFSKWVEGSSVSSTDQSIEGAIAFPPRRPPATPFGRK